MSQVESGSVPVGNKFRVIMWVVLEVLWLLVCTLPLIIESIYKKIFPGDGKDLKDKVVLITGAGNGLGKELALQFSREGCCVICVDIRAKDNENTAEQIASEQGNEDKVKAYSCDVGNGEDIKRLKDAVLKDFKHVDVLVNNAGIVYGNSILSGEDSTIRRVVDVNLLSSYWMTREFLPHMKTRKSGHIVFMNSMASLTPLAGGSIYCVTKHGLLGLALSLNEEIRQDPDCSKIKVTSVHPFFIGTDDWYMKTLFKNPVGNLKTSDAARQIITGIRREYLTFQVPGYDVGFWISCFLGMIPEKLTYMLRNIIKIDLNVQESDEAYSNIPLSVTD